MGLTFKVIMKKGIKIFLKVIAIGIAIVLLLAVLFVLTNLTLVKNLPTAQDGFADAMYIDNQRPLQLIEGAESRGLSLSLEGQGIFSDAHNNWEETGGKAFLIWHKGELVYETYADTVSSTDRSKSFSMHKSIVGLVAATMEADGIIDLDDPVSLYLNAYKKGGRETLSIRDMLQHKSGLERYPFSPPSLDALKLLLSDKVEKTAIKAKRIDSVPVFDYSNINYQVAGAALRKALADKKSQTYAEYLSSRIWSKVGAGDAYLWSETVDGAPRFYAGLQATARDWLMLGILIAENEGDIVPSSAIENFLAPSSLNADYGLGIWLGSPEDGLREYGPSTALAVPSAAPFILEDTAFFDGFGGQRVYISQSAELVIVRIGDVYFDWDDTALPNMTAKALGLKGIKAEAH